jgi:hypothetical protein
VLKQAILLLIVLVSFPPLSLAKEFQFVFDGDQNWELSDSARNDFNQFLQVERQRLINSVEGISIAGDYSDQNHFINEIVSTMPGYANYQVSCRFLQKVRGVLKGAVLKRFNEVTQNGKVCTVADMPKEKWSEWSLKLAEFFWTQPWIKKHKESFSLKKYLDRSVHLPVLPTSVVLMPVTSRVIEGYPTGYSTEDLKLLSQTPMAEIFELTKNIKVGDPSTYPSLGPDADETFKENQEGLAALFVTQPGIALSYGWAPMDMIDVLAHEYGHTLHALNQSFFRVEKNQALTSPDSVWHEAVAEAFAWNGLLGLE